MKSTDSVRALWHLIERPSRQRRLALEAAARLLTLKAILAFIPFKRWRKLLRATKGAPPGADSEARIAEIVWAVDRISSLFPNQLTCLPRALAVRAMLERRNFGCRLRIGVARQSSGKFEAHAWIECRGRIVIGNLPDLSRFAPLPDVDAPQVPPDTRM